MTGSRSLFGGVFLVSTAWLSAQSPNKSLTPEALDLPLQRTSDFGVCP